MPDGDRHGGTNAFAYLSFADKRGVGSICNDVVPPRDNLSAYSPPGSPPGGPPPRTPPPDNQLDPEVDPDLELSDEDEEPEASRNTGWGMGTGNPDILDAQDQPSLQKR